MSEGFPARGIISCNNTPTEALQDYIDFKVNPAMKGLKSYLKDTKHFVQVLEEANRTEMITDDVSIITADIDNMYGNMPLELSNQGIVEYCNSRTIPDEISSDATK